MRREIRARLAPWLVALVLAGCGNCSGSGALEVGGDTPYVRCLAAPAPAESTVRLGALSLRAFGRELHVDGLPRPAVLAAFSGPGFGSAPGPGELAALRAAKPDLMLLLGDIGDRAPTARATLASLASLPAPTLLLAGGRDTRQGIADAIGAAGAGHARIVDVTALRTIRFAHDTFIPIAGAADGHYAREDMACGYALSDLKQVASELGDDRAPRRWLLAWQAPASAGRLGVARDDQGVELGSPTLAELAKRIGAPGGVFAWPHVQMLRPSSGGGARRPGLNAPAADLQIVVPHLGSAASERSDGSRVSSGFALLKLGDDGLQLLDATSAR